MADKWYLATMNDGLAIIDTEPAPAPVDAINPNRPAPQLIIPLRHADRVTREVAEEIVREHNSAIARVCEPLDCAMCGAHQAFVINPLDSTVGYCMVEQKAWRIHDTKCSTRGCFNRKATFGDLCMGCLARAVDGEDLTPLQQAIVEHDDDMARLDRNQREAKPNG